MHRLRANSVLLARRDGHLHGPLLAHETDPLAPSAQGQAMGHQHGRLDRSAFQHANRLGKGVQPHKSAVQRQIVAGDGVLVDLRIVVRAQPKEDHLATAAHQLDGCSNLVAYRVHHNVGAQTCQTLDLGNRIVLRHVDRRVHTNAQRKLKPVGGHVQHDYLARAHGAIEQRKEQPHGPRADDGNVVSCLEGGAFDRADRTGQRLEESSIVARNVR